MCHWESLLACLAFAALVEPWRLERLAASGCVWHAWHLDVWASCVGRLAWRLGNVWFTSGSRLGTSRASGLVPRAHDVWARLGTSGNVWERLDVWNVWYVWYVWWYGASP